jgi:outer membrane protein assembly factor BamB
LPAAIAPDRNLLWSVKVPKGSSSPVVAGGLVFLTGHEGDSRLVLCHDAKTGRLLWQRTFAITRGDSFNPRHGPTTPSAASDGSRVFVFLPEVGLLAFAHGGQELWRASLGPFTSVQGLASSPVSVDGKVVLLVDTPQDAHVVAFDAETGRVAWKVDRPQVIVAGAVELTGYSAATGERLFWAHGVSAFPTGPPFVNGDSVYTLEPPGGVQWPPFGEPRVRFDANGDGRIAIEEATKDPFWARSLDGIDRNVGNRDGVVTAEEYDVADGSPDDGGLVRTRLGGRGDLRKSHVVWRQERGATGLTGALHYRGVLYVVRNAIVSTYDPETGRLLGQERVKDAPGEYYASPVAGDGKVYLVSLEGKVSVLEAGAPWRLLATGDLGEPVVATPAIADARLFIRTETTLFAFAAPPASAVR